MIPGGRGSVRAGLPPGSPGGSPSGIVQRQSVHDRRSTVSQIEAVRGNGRRYQMTDPSGSTMNLWVTTIPSRITWVEVSSESSVAGLVEDPHVAADAGVLVDDGPLDDRIGPDAEGSAD